MSGIEVRPFRRSDRQQLTDLVNAHVQAVVPGVSVSVNAVLSQLEREPGEVVVDQWVLERVTLVAEQRGRVVAATHLLRYGSGPEVGAALRGAAEIRWLLCAVDAPFWPDASAAGLALAQAAVARLRAWRPARVGADGTLPAPGVYGIPEQWPHVADLLSRVGFRRGERTEVVLLADVASLARPEPPPELRVVRTLGTVGTRLAALRGDCEVGFVEVDTGIGGSGSIAGQPGWADIGNLWVQEADRGRGIGSWLLGEAAEWLRLARVDRLLGYADPGTPGFLERSGFRRLTETARDWELPAS
ncbi:MAG TPA: GNAT family N-acetyltransferase [Mycobacteriales bacterium]|jgi:GNAT superfamily N-acetyltransferase